MSDLQPKNLATDKAGGEPQEFVTQFTKEEEEIPVTPAAILSPASNSSSIVVAESTPNSSVIEPNPIALVKASLTSLTLQLKKWVEALRNPSSVNVWKVYEKSLSLIERSIDEVCNEVNNNIPKLSLIIQDSCEKLEIEVTALQKKLGIQDAQLRIYGCYSKLFQKGSMVPYSKAFSEVWRLSAEEDKAWQVADSYFFNQVGVTDYGTIKPFIDSLNSLLRVNLMNMKRRYKHQKKLSVLK